ncbi:MAG: MFS transporter [Gammaproteobacteria bacterium]|nr:MFS transporter [Gammaproteobacteria bacterium]
MLSTIARTSTLLLGMGILLGGNGMLGTLLGVRAGLEGFPDAVTGAIMSAYFLAFIIGTFFCPAMIRRVGHVRAFAAMAAVQSAAAITHALVVQPVVWGVLRIITGVCMVGIFMVMESWLNVLAPNEQRGRIFAVYVTVNLTAMAIGQSFILVGDPRGVVPFALVSILLSLSLVPVALTGVGEPPPVDVPHTDIQELYAISPLGFFGTLTSGLCMGAFWGMGAVFAYGIGLSNAEIAAFMSATIVGGALLQFPIGRFSDRHDRRIVLTVACFAAAAFALLTFAAAKISQLGLLISAFLYGGFAFSLYSLSISHVNDHLAPAEVLNATSGLLLIYGIGATVGPAAAGLLMDALGPRTLLVYFAAVLALLGLFGVYRMRVGPPISTESQGPFVPMVRTSQAVLEMDPRADLESELRLK